MALGLTLGFIGWLICAVLPPTEEVRRRHAQENAEATARAFGVEPVSDAGAAPHSGANPLVWVFGGVLAISALAIAGAVLYTNVIKEDAPEKLTLSDDAGSTSTTPAADSGDSSATTAPAAGDSVDGEWTVTGDSVVGYRVPEVLFGQETEGVGRTSDVTGSMTIEGTTVTAASFEVDMNTVKSDSGNRDNQFRGRIMDTVNHPTSTFELTEPIDLGSIPADGTEISVEYTGDLTLKGTTKSVTLDMTARRDGDTISTLSNYTVVFADWGIDNPSFGPAEVGDQGTLEIKLVFEKA